MGEDELQAGDITLLADALAAVDSAFAGGRAAGAAICVASVDAATSQRSSVAGHLSTT